MNRLINETSPYLLQHASNPVDWYPWGEEALKKAKEEDKAILISIGYSTCHWCHVMERESFENEGIASYMNEYFVCIKIDREERPDLDAMYMDACVAMVGKGGWPMNLFLTPDLKPFFGGMYYPIEKTPGDSQTWQEALNFAAYNFYRNRRSVQDEAEKIMLRLKNKNKSTATQIPIPSNFIEQVYNGLIQKTDPIHGGFGQGMKFPNFMALDFMLNYQYYYGVGKINKEVEKAIQALISGGIYDHVGGGISRYTVDQAWKIPHFEKMGYDNAQLVGILADSIKIEQNDNYLKSLNQTCYFILNEMTDETGGFYAAFDAESEGEEGKFYTWEKMELEEILGEHYSLFSKYFNVEEKGNWEETNILFHDNKILKDKKELAIIEKCLGILKTKRDERPKPSLDDKMILSWNALMSCAFIKAYETTGNKDYFEAARKNIAFLRKTFIDRVNGKYQRTYCKKEVKGIANLRDMVYYVKSLLDLYNHTPQEEYLVEIQTLLNVIVDGFYVEKDKAFYFTSKTQKDIILPKQDSADQDMPSSNSILIEILYKGSLLTENDTYKKLADEILEAHKSMMLENPLLYASLAKQWLMAEKGIDELVSVGPEAKEFTTEINQKYIPNKLVFHTIKNNDENPLSRWKEVTDETLIYVCTGSHCKAPVDKLMDLDLS